MVLPSRSDSPISSRFNPLKCVIASICSSVQRPSMHALSCKSDRSSGLKRRKNAGVRPWVPTRESLAAAGTVHLPEQGIGSWRPEKYKLAQFRPGGNVNVLVLPEG